MTTAPLTFDPRKIPDLSRTKLVATVGPASREPQMLLRLMAAGVDVFRINMAHGSREEHDSVLKAIRQAAREFGRPVGVLIDLAGPKIRLGNLLAEPLELQVGELVTLTRNADPQSPTELTSNYEPMLDELQVGHEIVLADGAARLRVVMVTAESATCEVIEPGSLRSRQGINLPDTNLSISAMTERDLENALWAASTDIDFVSISFVRNAEEIHQLKTLLSSAGSEARVIAKIEKREALENLQAIVQATDGVMVARGDLGVEIELEKTPLVQKRIIRLCQDLGKPVIVATQMLESMHHSKQPTRAEVSDVANAILDGADACMLSGETAIGSYPEAAVRMMKRIMHETESLLRNRASRGHHQTADQKICMHEAMLLGAAQVARHIDARLLVLVTEHSTTALLKSKQRDFVTTVCLTDDQKAAQRMSLYWGVVPVMIDSLRTYCRLPKSIADWAKEHLGLLPSQRLVFVLDTADFPDVLDTIAIAEIS